MSRHQTGRAQIPGCGAAGRPVRFAAGGPLRRLARIALGVTAGLGLLATVAHARDIERIEAVGSAPIYPGGTSRQVLRDRAVRRAVSGAVRKAAGRLVDTVDPEQLDRLEATLGDDPFQFVSRFSVVEDRGVQPALFHSNPEVESEYRVIVEVDVDRDLVRSRLVANQLLEAPSGVYQQHEVRIALEGLENYQDYESIRSALVSGAGARSATPIEAMPGRIVIAADVDRRGLDLLDALERSIPPHLQLISLQVDTDLLRLRVTTRTPSALDAEASAPGPAAAESGEIDTTGRNRY